MTFAFTDTITLSGDEFHGVPLGPWVTVRKLTEIRLVFANIGPSYKSDVGCLLGWVKPEVLVDPGAAPTEYDGNIYAELGVTHYGVTCEVGGDFPIDSSLVSIAGCFNSNPIPHLSYASKPNVYVCLAPPITLSCSGIIPSTASVGQRSCITTLICPDKGQLACKSLKYFKIKGPPPCAPTPTNLALWHPLAETGGTTTSNAPDGSAGVLVGGVPQRSDSRLETGNQPQR